MTERLNKIYSELMPCEIFADIGCDHGYITECMLKNKKCKKAIVSDISAKCLKKAQVLLERFVKNGTCECIVSDGFDNLPKCDEALIAGLGGEEIVAILKRLKTFPEKLILQPMKNADKVRLCAVSLGYKIVKDFVFYSANIYYNLIVLERGEDRLSQAEIEFGRTNLQGNNQDFQRMISEEIKKIQGYIDGGKLSDSVEKEMKIRIERLSEYDKIR